MAEIRDTLVFFHTAPALIPLFTEMMRSLAPGQAVRHKLRDDLLTDAIKEGAATPRILSDATEAMLDEATPDVAMILCTCSTIGEAAELAHARGSIPILRIDRAMARRSVELGERILVMATLATTIGPTIALIKAEAAAIERRPVLNHVVLDEARAFLLAGRQEDCLEAIAAALRGGTRDADVVVLAQASMAAAIARAGQLPVPVLTSPQLGLTDALNQLADLRRKKGS